MTTIVIGGGPAGLIAAYFRANRGENVTLIEKNEKPGKKLYITGKGRCNVTNDCDVDEFLSNVVSNARFLNGAIRRFPPEKFMEFLSGKTKLKTERGNRVFPLSDKASDVTKCLCAYAEEAGAEIKLNEKVLAINAADGKVVSVVTDKATYPCDNVIVCTGGLSYPSTGSTGDGYAFAKSFGHTIISPVAALSGINLKGDFYKNLQGLSLKNVAISVFNGKKKIYSDFGEMLFTHFGASGPTIISASSFINRLNLGDVYISLDLKPALTAEQLDARVLRDFEKYKNKAIKNSLDDLLPKAMIPVIIKAAGISGDIKNSELKAENRRKIIAVIKDFRLYPHSLRDLNEAIVTSGGVSVKEIDPRTMESKLVKGLFFAGEVIDADALTGGFNITIAACTAYSAGNA
ncbi:MAG: NAD(P)/FAD-dependent oxidoreductase [Clostridiales bacterium]|nr:NAD(P)/FAD-dependent oxidoreductase [Clostridiales bacterium]MDY2900561.1 NAD(P)/FAD-dependent oxidoreductase [Christensenellaceae bacterium]